MSVDGKNIAITAAAPPFHPSAAAFGRASWRRLMRSLASAGIYYRFTTITGRIVALNIASLLVLVIGMLYLSDFRNRLIDTRSKTLRIEASVIARSLVLDGSPKASDVIDDAIFGQPLDNSYTISLEKSFFILRSLTEKTKTRGYIYTADGSWLADTSRIYQGGKLTRIQPPTRRSDDVSSIYQFWLSAERMMRGESLPKLNEGNLQSGKSVPEIKGALEQGSESLLARENDVGETILSLATPIEKGGKVLGALLLLTVDGEIDATLAEERASVIRIWLLVLAVTTGGSIILAGTIAGPMHRLAQAAESVRKNIKTRAILPDYSHRSDEIGHLANALQEMTSTLYSRLEAIESFAADVSHELKNPITSLHSAMGAFALIKKEEDRERLVQIMLHDVQRLDRLITDISDASRLDSELARESRRPVNIAQLLQTLCGAINDVHRDCKAKIDIQIKGVMRAIALSPKSPFYIQGHEGRLHQVISNILDNAMSFSPPDAKIRIACSLVKKTREVEITVEDDGPGIPAENLERIFERFYTDRPGHEEFGKNSGLGLNISRQIVSAHSGRIWAENRLASPVQTPDTIDAPARIIGARFVIRLPAIA
jgi:two-component system sensor histidine kinase ChvG